MPTMKFHRSGPDDGVMTPPESAAPSRVLPSSSRNRMPAVAVSSHERPAACAEATLSFASRIRTAIRSLRITKGALAEGARGSGVDDSSRRARGAWPVRDPAPLPALVNSLSFHAMPERSLSHDRLRTLLDAASGLRIAVVGDAMLDV